MFVQGEMTYPAYIREKARELRREKKLTIDELAERLALSRTTIYYWVKDMPIPRTAREARAQRAATRATIDKHRRLREAAYDKGLLRFAELDRDRSFREFVVLFIAEGYKRSRNSVAIANSDPAAIKLANRWMQALSRNKLGYQVQFHADQDVRELQRFWSSVLRCCPQDINLQRKSNSSQLSSRSWRSEHGVLTVRTCDTYFRAELQAWVDRVRDSWLN